MRAFLGVPLPAFEELADVLERIAATRADAKLSRPDQFHLTTLFLGEVAESLAATLLQLVRAEALPAPFDVVARDVGAFPDWRRGNVLWAGIDDPAGGLSALHGAAARAWTSLGQATEDRPFHPHLTLGRKRTDRGMDEAKALLAELRGLTFGTAHVERMNLYRSTLTPAGPRYDVVGAVTL